MPRNQRLHDVIFQSSEATTIANKDDVIPTSGSLVDIINALNCVIDRIRHSVYFTAIREEEPLQANFNILPHSFRSAFRHRLGGLGGRIAICLAIRLTAFYRFGLRFRLFACRGFFWRGWCLTDRRLGACCNRRIRLGGIIRNRYLYIFVL